MKKLILSICIGLPVLFISCSQAEKSSGADPAGTTNNEKSEREKMIRNNEKINNAIVTGNFDGIDTLWADNVVDHSGPMGKEVHGRDSLKAMLMAMRKSMKDIKIETKTTGWDPEKGYLFSLARVTGTTLIPMEGMPANTKIDMSSVDVVKIENGKATDHWSFNSPEDMMKMMNSQRTVDKAFSH